MIIKSVFKLFFLSALFINVIVLAIVLCFKTNLGDLSCLNLINLLGSIMFGWSLKPACKGKKG